MPSRSAAVDGPVLTKLVWLGALYVVQGLPFGFQASALPMYLRTADRSLTEIGLASFLALPWMLKVLWAPWVDRYGSAKFGRRKSWIVPLQLLLAVTCGLMALTSPDEHLRELLILVLLTNLFAATMDIAVDGLAVDLLRETELGLGNAIQVVGFKLGMLTGGGLLVWASAWVGWHGLFGGMATMVLAAMLLTLRMREPVFSGASFARAKPLTRSSDSAVASPPVPDSSGGLMHLELKTGEAEPAERNEGKPSADMRQLIGLFFDQLRSQRAVLLLVLVATYKMGETLADAMLRPFLIDAGFTPEALGLWLGTYGMAASIAGSVVGGLLATRSLHGALLLTAVARALPVIGEWWLTTHDPSAVEVIAITSAESFFGGALTTAMFAFMMSRVDPRIGASHFTLLASVEVFGKLPLAPLAGALADARGYGFVFAIAAGLCVVWPFLLAPILRTGGFQPGRRDP